MHKIKTTIALMSLLVSGPIYAKAYELPNTNQSLIGDIEYRHLKNGDSMPQIAKHYDLGYNALKYANPHLKVKKDLQAGKLLQIPARHLLPKEKRQGFVVNLPEMRMYYYPKGSGEVLTYPIGIGSIGRTIPIKHAKITFKKKNPEWKPPKSIREYNLKKGIILPRVMPPGPDNPLGTHAIYMSIPTYLMHSTIYPESVGQRASFGCLRMYESDIATMYPTVTSGMPVAIINQPVKFGWHDQTLYMEAHHALKEHRDEHITNYKTAVHEITNNLHHQPALIDWHAVAYLAKERDGIPHDIGMRI